MKSKVYSFSVAKETDKELVNEIKKDYDKQGISFSWVVMQALKQYTTKTKEHKNGQA